MNWASMIGLAVTAGWLFRRVKKRKLLVMVLSAIWLLLLLNLRLGPGTRALFQEVTAFFAAGLASWGADAALRNLGCKMV